MKTTVPAFNWQIRSKATDPANGGWVNYPHEYALILNQTYDGVAANWRAQFGYSRHGWESTNTWVVEVEGAKEHLADEPPAHSEGFAVFVLL